MRASGVGIAIVLWFAVVPAGRAATLVETDFRRGTSDWVVNGDAHLLTVDGRQLLSLTQNEQEQIGMIWTRFKQRVSSFSFIADLRVRFDPFRPGDEPADGVAMVFADVEPDALRGVAGGSLGVFGAGLKTMAGFEINTYSSQGLGPVVEGKNVTFAFDALHPGLGDFDRREQRNGTPEEGGVKVGQVLPPRGMKIVNGGFYRYQWNADSATNTLSVFVTGLEESNRQFQQVEVLKVRFSRNPIDFAGRFGLTAATGGFVQHAEVAAVRIEVPMVPPRRAITDE